MHLLHKKEFRVEQQFCLVVHEKKRSGWGKNFKLVKQTCSLNRCYKVLPYSLKNSHFYLCGAFPSFLSINHAKSWSTSSVNSPSEVPIKRKFSIRTYLIVCPKLYIPSTINIWKKVLTKAIWADKKWAGFWQISL